jgi:hypothetical protein
MFPLGFVVGAVAGAAGAVLFGRQIVEHGRPLAKAALKATLAAMHEARVRGTEVGEAAEDLYAEAKAEVTEEIFQAAMAAATAKAAEMAEAAKNAKNNGSSPQDQLAEQSDTKAATSPASVKRSRVGQANG